MKNIIKPICDFSFFTHIKKAEKEKYEALSNRSLILSETKVL